MQNGDADDLAIVLRGALFGEREPSSGDGYDERDGFTEAMRTPDLAPGSQPQSSPSAPAGGDAGPSLALANDTTVTVDRVHNALVVQATPQQYAVIEAALHELDVVCQFRVLGSIGFKQRYPFAPRTRAACAHARREMLVYSFGHQKLFILGPVVAALRELDLLVAERLAVCCGGVLLVW